MPIKEMKTKSKKEGVFPSCCRLDDHHDVALRLPPLIPLVVLLLRAPERDEIDEEE